MVSRRQFIIGGCWTTLSGVLASSRIVTGGAAFALGIREGSAQNGNGGGNGGGGNGGGNGGGGGGGGGNGRGGGNGGGGGGNGSGNGGGNNGGGGNGNGGGKGNSSGASGASKGKNSTGSSLSEPNPSTRDAVTSAGSALEVRHRNGMQEVVTDGRYVMRDNRGRTIVNRAATTADLARIRSMLE